MVTSFDEFKLRALKNHILKFILFFSECKLIAHRSCAATGLPICAGPASSNFRHIILSSPFGLSLCTPSQFSPEKTSAPLFLIRCCQEILARAHENPSLDLYHLYKTPPNKETLAKLRNAWDVPMGSIDMRNPDLRPYEPHVIAYLIKRYLMELPDPVIPSASYERFINAARSIQNDDQCAKVMKEILSDINPHHYCTLK